MKFWEVPLLTSLIIFFTNFEKFWGYFRKISIMVIENFSENFKLTASQPETNFLNTICGKFKIFL